MTQTTRDVRTRLRYDVEGVPQAVAAADRVRGAVERIEDPLGQIGISAAGGVRRLRSEFNSAENDVEALRRETNAFIDDLHRLDSVHATPTVTVQGGGSGARRGRLESIERTGSVGTQILSGLGQTELANVAGLIGDTAGALTSLNPVMLAVTAAGAGLAVVFGDIQRRAEEARVSGERWLATQVELNRLLASGGTRDVLVARFEEQRQELDAVTAALERINPELTELERQFNDNEITFTEWETRSAALQAAFGQGVIETERLRAAMALTTEAMTSQTLTENELAAATEATFQQQNDAKAFAIKQTELEAQAEEELAATREQATEKIKQVALAEMERAQAAQEAAQQGLTDAVDALFDANTDLIDKTNALQKAEAALAESTENTAEKIQSINADSEDRRTKALDKALDAREDAERDHLQAVADIERRAHLSVRDAVRTRDVVAAIQARETRQEELRKENQSNDRRLDSLQDSLDDQLESIQDNARRSLQTVQRQGRDELAAKQQAVDRARVELVNAENAQLALEKGVHIAQQNANVAHYNTLMGVHDKGMTAIANLITSKYQGILGRVGGSGTSGGKTLSGQNTTPFAFTGSQQQGSGKSLTINIQGMSRLDVQRQINTALRQVWE